MNPESLKERISRHPRLKKLAYTLIMHPVKTRPRRWIRLFSFLYVNRGKGSVVYRSVRKDLTPFHRFALGRRSVVEDFSCLNNAMGGIQIGNHTRIGLGSTIIGPVRIGSHVNLAQHITVSALNHRFKDIHTRIDEQGVSVSEVIIEDDVWIGAHAVILPGTRIGRHTVVAAGSVVSRSIPPYSVCAGVPAKVIKRYDTGKGEWVSAAE